MLAAHRLDWFGPSPESDPDFWSREPEETLPMQAMLSSLMSSMWVGSGSVARPSAKPPAYPSLRWSFLRGPKGCTCPECTTANQKKGNR